jgi:hypothetical protein
MITHPSAFASAMSFLLIEITPPDLLCDPVESRPFRGEA